MSVKVAVKYLPKELTHEEKTDLLKHFGATEIQKSRIPGDIIALFDNREQALHAIRCLHQVQLGSSLPLSLRIILPKSGERSSSPIPTSDELSALNKYVEELNSWCPSLGFTSPGPIIKYKYPDATETIVLNIANALLNYPPLYVQTLHLMNKMGLDPPFGPLGSRFKENFPSLFSGVTSMPIEVSVPPLPPGSSEEDTEMSDDSEDVNNFEQPAAFPSKRKSRLKTITKRPKISFFSPHSTESKGEKIQPKDVFEETVIREPKKIVLKVDTIDLDPSKPSERPEEAPVSDFGKIDPIQSDNRVNVIAEDRLSANDMKLLPVFKNYNPGQPSVKLYIKNVSKDVSSEDLQTLYLRYLSEEEQKQIECLEVKLMQEGRMKGQAFVEFPSIATSSLALNETNGYILKGKPLVVQFGRTKT